MKINNSDYGKTGKVQQAGEESRRSLYKTLAHVALPIAAQGLISSSLSLIDNLMIGSLGETELASAGLATQFFIVHWLMLFGFCSGSAAFVSQFWGARDLGSIRKVTGFMITAAMGASIILFFVPAMFFPERILSFFTDVDTVVSLGTGYMKTGAICFIFIAVSVPFTTALRATQQTKLPLIISSTAFIMNTCLNYVFVSEISALLPWGFPAARWRRLFPGLSR